MWWIIIEIVAVAVAAAASVLAGQGSEGKDNND